MVDGFSSADPRLARGPQISAGKFTKRRTGGGGRAPRTDSVRISGNTVFINDKGFSVAPSLQAQFIQQRTGGRGSSAQSAIAAATKLEDEKRKIEALKLKQLEAAKQREFTRIRNTSVSATNEAAKQKLIKKKANELRNIRINIQNRKAEQFQQDVRSGRLVGVSGIGLSPSEVQKRKFLVDTGAFRESSSKDNIFRNVDPLTATYFLDTRPSQFEKIDLVNYLKSQQYSTALANLSNGEKNWIDRGARGINNTINKLKKAKTPSNQTKLSNEVMNKRNKFLVGLAKLSITQSRWNIRQAKMFALGLSASVLSGASFLWQAGKKAPATAKAITVGTPAFVRAFVKDPKAIITTGYTVSKQIGKALVREGKIFAQLIVVEPGLAAGYIAGELFLMKGAGKTFSLIGKASQRTKKLISLPLLKKISKTPIILKKIPNANVVNRGGKVIVEVAGNTRGGKTVRRAVIEAKKVIKKKADIPRRKIARFELASIQAIRKGKVSGKNLLAFIKKQTNFPLPKAIQKTLIKKKTLGNLVEEYKKFKKGSLNAAFLKAKNAQLIDKSRGTFASVGKAARLEKSVLNGIWGQVKGKGFTRRELFEGAYYTQKFRVLSEVPKWNALIKITQSALKGKRLRVNKVSRYYEFVRHGIIVTKVGKDGVVRAFAIEFNKVGSKISSISFKSAVGRNKITAIKVYRKVRKIKGKGTRVKFSELFLAKGKLESKVPLSKNLIKIFNTLETKKVFLGNNKLLKKEIIGLKTAIKRDLTVAKGGNLERALRKIYKDKLLSSKAILTNTVKIKQVGNIVRIVPSIKKRVINFKISPKGKFIEFGHSKMRIPSIKRISTIEKLRKPKPKPKPRGRVIQLQRVSRNLRSISKPTQTTGNRLKQITIKKTATKGQVRQVKLAVKSIQTITRPAVRIKKIIPKSTTKKIVGKIRKIIPLVGLASAQALVQVSRALIATAKAQDSLKALKTISAKKLLSKQIQDLQSASLKALISIKVPITPIIPRAKPRPPKRPAAKKRIIIPKKPRPAKIRKVVRKKKDLGYVSGLKSKPEGRVTKALVSIPIAKERAFDIVAYSMLRSKKPAGIVKKSQKREPLSVINRKLISIPKGYFKRHRSKFLVRRIKGRVETFEVIRKSTVKKKVARRKPIKKRLPKRRKMVKRKQRRKVTSKIKRLPKKRKVARRKPVKRRPTTRRRIKRR